MQKQHIRFRRKPITSRSLIKKEKDHDYTEPHLLEMPESSSSCSGPACSTAACRCAGGRAGGDCALFLTGGPPAGAVPLLAFLAPVVLATVAQPRPAGTVRGGESGRPRGAEFPLGRRLGSRWLYLPWD